MIFFFGVALNCDKLPSFPGHLSLFYDAREIAPGQFEAGDCAEDV